MPMQSIMHSEKQLLYLKSPSQDLCQNFKQKLVLRKMAQRHYQAVKEFR